MKSRKNVSNKQKKLLVLGVGLAITASPYGAYAQTTTPVNNVQQYTNNEANYTAGTTTVDEADSSNVSVGNAGTVDGKGNIAIGDHIKIYSNDTAKVPSPDNNIIIGNNSDSSFTNNIIIGHNAMSYKPNTNGGAIQPGPDGDGILGYSVIIGNGASSGSKNYDKGQTSPTTNGAYAVAIGQNASVISDFTVALGSGASVTGSSAYSIAIGGGKVESDGTTIGSASVQFAPRSIAIGSYSNVMMMGSDMVALGHGANIEGGSGNVAIGAKSTDGNYTAFTDDATYFGSYYGSGTTKFKDVNNVTKNGASDQYGEAVNAVVSIGGGDLNSQSGFTRRLINLTAGAADTDAVNVAQLKNLAANKISFQTDKGITDKVALGEVNTADDDETRMQFNIKGINNSGIITSADGKQVNIGIDYSKAAEEVAKYLPANPIVYTDGQGNKLVKIGADYYPEDQVKGKIKANDGKFYPASELDANGNPIAGANGTKLTPVKTGDVYASGVGNDGNLTTPVKLTNLQSGLGLNNMPTTNQAGTTIAKDPAIAATQDLLTKTGKDLYNAATIGDLQAIAQGGLSFTDGQATVGTIHAPLSTSIKIQGKATTDYAANDYSADNLVTVANDNDKSITISMKKNPEFTTVVLGDNNKVTLGADANGNLNLGDKKITGVSNGVDDKDAVNMSQLNELAKKIKNIKGGDGGASTIVYTKADGTVVEKAADGKFYPKDELAKYKLAKDGKYYLPAEVDDDGELVGNPTAATLNGGVDAGDVNLSTVNPDGTTTNPTSLGNLKSALDLTGMNKTNITQGEKVDASTQDKANEIRKIIAGDTMDGTGGLYAKTGKDLYKATTLGDLQAVAAAGLTFTGNEGTKTAALGTEVLIKGKSDVTTVDNNYSADNIATKVDGNTVTINMKKKPDFTGVNLVKDGEPDKKVSMTYGDNNTVKFEGVGNTDEEKQVVLSGLKDDPSDLTSAVTQSSFQELKNQISGVGGDTNAIVYVDKDGNRLVRDGDKFYKKDELQGKTKAKDGKYYDKVQPNGEKAADAQEVAPLTGDALNTIKLVPVDGEGNVAKPMEMGHIKSGIGLENVNMPNDMKEAADNAEHLQPITSAKAREIVAGTKKDGTAGLYLKNNSDLYKVSTVGDLQAVAMAGLTFKADDTAQEIHRPLGTELNIKTGTAITDTNKDEFNNKNLGTKINTTDNTISVEMKKDIAVDTITLGGNDPATNNTKLGVDAQGNIIINPKNPATPNSPFVESENPKEIRGLGKGTQEDSAVNLKQLNTSLDDLNNRINYLNEGSAGNVVYTDDEGVRVTPVRKDGQTTYYYIKDIVDAGLKQIVEKKADGSEERVYYKKAEYDAWKNGNGTTPKPNPVNIATELNGKEVPEKKITLSTVNGDGSTQNPESLGNVASALGLANMDIEKGVADSVKDVADKVKAAKGFKPVNDDGSANHGDDTQKDAAKNVDTARKVVAGDKMDGTGGIYGAEGRDLYKVTTLGDLQAVAAAGLTFNANETVTATNDDPKNIHRPLGTFINIIGKEIPKKADYDVAIHQGNYTAENIITTIKDSNTIQIKFKDNPEFSGVDLVQRDKDGNVTNKINMTLGGDNGDRLVLGAGNDQDPANNNKPVVLSGIKDDVNDPNSAITRQGVKDAIKENATFQYVDKDGNPLEKIGGKLFNVEAIKDLKPVIGDDGSIKFYPQDQLQADGTPKDDAQASEVAPIDDLKDVTLAPIAPNGEVGKKNDATGIDNLKSGIGLSDEDNLLGVATMPANADEINTAKGLAPLKKDGDKVVNNPEDVNKVRQIVAGKDKNGVNEDGTPAGIYALTGKDLYKATTVGDLQAVAASGITFRTDEVDENGNPVEVTTPLGTAIKITGNSAINKDNKDSFNLNPNQGNIGTAIGENGEVIVAMKKKPTFEGVELANGNDPAKKVGMNIGDDGQSVVFGTPNADGNLDPIVIRGIKDDPTDPTSAVTRKSLMGIEGRINAVEDGANAGVAAAMASGNIPQIINTKNRHAIGVGLGNYKNANAFAIGLTGVNKKRTIIYKVTGTYDSSNTFAIGAGLSFTYGRQDKLEDILKEERELYPGEFNARILKQEHEIENLKSTIDVLQDEIKRLMSEIKNLKNI